MAGLRPPVTTSTVVIVVTAPPGRVETKVEVCDDVKRLSVVEPVEPAEPADPAELTEDFVVDSVVPEA